MRKRPLKQLLREKAMRNSTARKKASRRRAPVYDHGLLVALALKATDHVAPYRRLECSSTVYWDAMAVVKAFRLQRMAWVPIWVHKRLAVS